MSPGFTAQLACVLEATARKPGNVHRFADFADADYLDFILSAQAILGPLDRAVQAGLGRTVLDCVVETRRVVTTNTNLGLILLLAPLAAIAESVPIREGVRALLAATDIEDARLVFEAIRLARPGGLNSVPDQDAHDEPTITLIEAMRLAADHDLIAKQYVGGYAEVFDLAVVFLGDAIAAGYDWEVSVVLTQLKLMSRVPDTLIARKRGEREADQSALRARAVLDAGWPDTPRGAGAFYRFDRWLRAAGHSRNPGTTADLVAAALFVALRDGTIQLPLASRKSDGWAPRVSLGR